MPVTLLTSTVVPKEQNNFLNLSIRSLVLGNDGAEPPWISFFNKLSTEQNLTATKAEDEEVKEQGLGNHRTEYQHLHTHYNTQWLQTLVELLSNRMGAL